MIDINSLLYLPDEFIETVEEDESSLYADTDSAYLLYDLPFNKYDNVHQLVDYVQKIAIELGSLYNEALNLYTGTFANMNPKYNTMDFKSEVVAYRGFFSTKKFYGLALAWLEGTFYENNPKLKTVGGQIKKSDLTPITKLLLTEIYNILVLELDEKDMEKIYRFIFVELRNKYRLQLMNNINNLEFKSFSTPKKWGGAENTPPIMGAKLFNCIIEDTFRQSDSFIVVKVRLDIERLKEFILAKDKEEDSNILSYDDVISLGSNLNNISIPPIMTDTQKEKLLYQLKNLNIKLEYDEIIEANIDQKISAFDKLFTDEIKMRVL